MRQTKKPTKRAIERGKTYDPNRQFPLRLELTDKAVEFDLKGVEYKKEKSEISGAERIIYGTKPVNIKIKKYDEARVSASVAPPLFYIVPPQWTKVIETIKAHGIKFQKIEKPLKTEIESYRFEDVKWSDNSFEGRVNLSFKTVPIKETRTFPANSIIIPLDQTAADVAIHLLEPNAPDSFMFWGFFNPIFEQKEYGEGYIVEKLAREMLEKDANLRKGIRGKIKRRKICQKRVCASEFFLHALALLRQKHWSLSGRCGSW